LQALPPRPQQAEVAAGACPLAVVREGFRLTGRTEAGCGRLQERIREALARAGFDGAGPVAVQRAGVEFPEEDWIECYREEISWR